MNTTITEFENKIPDTSSLNTATVLDTKISDHAKYITTQEFNKLTAENFAATLKQVDLVSKTDFYNKLISFNRKITSNKTKYLEVQKKLNCLKTKDYNFFFGRIFFTLYDGYQNTFVYQPTLDMLELKNEISCDLFWNELH